MFNADTKGLGFFGMLNADANGIEKSWFGGITLQPINSGKAPSNSSTDYYAVLNLSKNGDLFDEDPIPMTSAEKI